MKIPTFALLPSTLFFASTWLFPLRAELLGHWSFDHNTDPSPLSQSRTSWELKNSATMAKSDWLGQGSLNLAPEGFAELPSPSAFQGGSARSVSVWVKLSTPGLPAKTKATILSAGQAKNLERWEVRFDHASKPGLNVLTEGPSRLYPLPATQYDTWNHVAVAQSGSALDTLKVWWNGKPLEDNGRPFVSKPMNTARKPLLLGTSVKPETGTDKREFPGGLDDLGIWDHAITEREAALIHGLGRAGDFSLLWLEDARRLSEAAPGTQASLNGKLWEKVAALDGPTGTITLTKRGEPGATIVTDGTKGEGIRLVPGR